MSAYTNLCHITYTEILFDDYFHKGTQQTYHFSCSLFFLPDLWGRPLKTNPLISYEWITSACVDTVRPAGTGSMMGGGEGGAVAPRGFFFFTPFSCTHHIWARFLLSPFFFCPDIPDDEAEYWTSKLKGINMQIHDEVIYWTFPFSW